MVDVVGARCGGSMRVGVGGGCAGAFPDECRLSNKVSV
jgi:hypothetical protein